MKARVFSEFRTQRPGEKKNSTIEVGEVVEGALASAAVANGFAKEVEEDTPVGKSGAAVAAAPQRQPERGGKGGKNKKPAPIEDDGGSGDGGGQGEGE